MPNTPTIPQTITVHLGAPGSQAENVTLPFLDYIANVASSEIYPTWPESAIRANIYAQISFALNRVYTEYYRTRGFDYDITNSTAFDQSFVNGRDIFENIQQIVGEIFDSYIRRENSVQPLFAQYCNGTTVTCNGLSQWGSVELANRGYTPFEILQYYYGDDIELVENVPMSEPMESAPTVPLRLGSVGNDVRTAQIRLNRISANYPSIPKILLNDGIFGSDTEAAVRRFQEVFGLTPDSVIGTIPVRYSDLTSELSLCVKDSLVCYLPAGLEIGKDITYSIRLDESAVKAPVSPDTPVGYVAVIYQGRTLGTLPLYTVSGAEYNFFAAMMDTLRETMSGRVFLSGTIFFVLALSAWIVTESVIARRKRHKWDKYFSEKMNPKPNVSFNKRPRRR